jgi:hypothetical protein
LDKSPLTLSLQRTPARAGTTENTTLAKRNDGNDKPRIETMLQLQKVKWGSAARNQTKKNFAMRALRECSSGAFKMPAVSTGERRWQIYAT